MTYTDNKGDNSAAESYKWGIVLLILVIVSISLAVSNSKLRSRVELLESTPELQSQDIKVLNFMSDFINLVLGSTEEVSFEDRLKLENEVRIIEDPELLEVWQTFTESSDPALSQDAAVSILRQAIEA